MKDKLIKICLILIIVFLITTGVALLWTSNLPFESVKVKIDSYALYGKTDKFTVALFEQIVTKLRFIAIVMFLASGLLYLSRRQLQQYTSNMLTSLSSFIRELSQHFNEAVKKEDKIHLFSLFIILLVAISIRLFFLFQPISNDEAVTFFGYAVMPLYIGLSNYSAPNNHLFHTFLVHMAYLLLGNQPWVIRLPALLAGILLVPASYIVIRIFYNKYAALLTAGIIASSTVLVAYSTYARGYTMVCLIFLLILALSTYLKQSTNSAAWLLFAILSALGFYTIPIMLFPFGIVVIWLFLSIVFQNTGLSRIHLLKNMFIFLIISALLTFMLYAPVFAISGLKSVIANPYVASKSWSYLIAEFPPSLSLVWKYWNEGIPSVLSFFLVIGFFISLVFHKRLSIHRVPVILAVAIGCILILIVQRVVPSPRVWLFLLPLYIGLACSGVSYFLRPVELKTSHYKSGIFAIVAIILSFWLSLNVVQLKAVYYASDPHCSKELRDNEQIAVFLKDYLKPGDRVLDASFPDPPLIYYFKLYDIPVKYLASDLDSSNRILIIVNEQIQTLEGFLDKKGLFLTSFSVPKLIKQYKLASLYEINRLSDEKEK